MESVYDQGVASNVPIHEQLLHASADAVALWLLRGLAAAPPNEQGRNFILFRGMKLLVGGSVWVGSKFSRSGTGAFFGRTQTGRPF